MNQRPPRSLWSLGQWRPWQLPAASLLLVVACQSLPSVLGGIPVENHLLTRLGEIVLAGAVVPARTVSGLGRRAQRG